MENDGYFRFSLWKNQEYNFSDRIIQFNPTAKKKKQRNNF